MTANATPQPPLTLEDLRDCFAGLVPAVIATASAAGVPNVTYLSRAHPVDAERIAVSNQFLSKSSRNLAENPRASLLIVRPETHEEFRLTAVYERTERRGPIFDRLRNDISMIAALTGMQDVFRLSSADIYRVTDIELLAVIEADAQSDQAAHDTGPGPLGELCARLSRCADLDTLVRVTVDGLAELLGYEHSQLLLVDEDASRLFTIASHGYASEGIGAEIAMGEGLVGRSAAQCAPIIVGNFSQMNKYAHTVRRSFQQASNIELPETPMVGLSRPGSQLAVPALALGQLVGVVMAEHTEAEWFTNADAATLTVVASIVASSIETLRAEVRTAGAVALATTTSAMPAFIGTSTVLVRHFAADGSTFLDGSYLIKGVAGKLLWSLLRQHESEGRREFTNREVRLDPTLELPDFRDNFESRLILLKRRLDEHEAPIRIEKTGRGRFRLLVDATPRLELVPAL